MTCTMEGFDGEGRATQSDPARVWAALVFTDLVRCGVGVEKASEVYMAIRRGEYRGFELEGDL